jgi:hypothetical protein
LNGLLLEHMRKCLPAINLKGIINQNTQGTKKSNFSKNQQPTE